MKMIIAVNNKTIEEKLTNKYYSKYEIYIVKSTDMILKLILSEKQALVILKDDIKGSISFKELITNIKRQNNNIQVIVLVKELTNEIKELLFAKEIFNIIEGKKFSFDELQDLIENPKMIVYKEKKNNAITSNVICVTGGRATGKTVVSIILGRILAKNKNKKVLVLDFDLVYPTLEVYLDVNKNFSLTDYINDLMNNKLKSTKNYESSDLKYSNLKYILNSKSIGIPSNDVIVRIIESLRANYDYVVVDTSTLMLNKIYTVAKLKNYNVISVVEPGKKAVKDYMLENIYLNKEINLIVVCNKKTLLYSLKKCSRDYKTEVLGYIRYSSFFRYFPVIKNLHFVSNLRRVLKKIRLNKIENLKEKIIRKVLGIEEEK